MDWLGIAGLVIGLVGIPLAFWAGRRNRQRPDLRASTDFDQVMAPLSFAGGLRLTWKKRSLTQVSRTNIAVWNHRGDTVRGDDIVEADPLRIAVADDDEILQVRIASFSREQNQMVVDGKAISFDFLDARDGAVLEVLHLGDAPARIVGTVRGAKIRNASQVDLSPAARTTRRLPVRKRFFAPGPGRMRRLFTAANVLLILIGLGLVAVFIAMLSSRLPMLVEPTAYDLGTLQGQADFASRVRKIGLPTQSLLDVWLPLAGIIVVWLAAGGYSVWRLVSTMRSVAPAEIFAFDTDGPESAASEIAATTSEGRDAVVNVRGEIIIRRGADGQFYTVSEKDRGKTA